MCRAGGEIDADVANRAIDAKPLQKGIGHEKLAVGAGMEAVAAADIVLRPQRAIGHRHGVDHCSVNVGEPLPLLRGQAPVDVAEVGESVVVGDVGRLVGHRLARAEEVGVDRAGGADDHRLHAEGVEPIEDLAHVRFVRRADLTAPGLVAAVVHPVAEGDDVGTEDRQIVVGPVGEAAGGLPAPAKLHDANIRDTGAGQQPAFDILAVELLLGDRVADDRHARLREKGRFLGAGSAEQGHGEDRGGAEQGREGMWHVWGSGEG